MFGDGSIASPGEKQKIRVQHLRRACVQKQKCFCGYKYISNFLNKKDCLSLKSKHLCELAALITGLLSSSRDAFQVPCS